MLNKPRPSLQQIGEGIYAFIGAGGDSNAGAVLTASGLVAIDAQQTVTLAKTFRSSAEAALDRPVDMLVNTHFHLDHTAGNIAFADVPILAHERTVSIMAEYLGGASENGTWRITGHDPKLRLFFGSNIRELVLPGTPDETWFLHRMSGPEYQTITLREPTETFADRLAMAASGGPLRLDYWGPSHCEGHLVIWLDAAKVAFLGDLLFVGRFPWLGDCDLDGWIATLDRILTMDLKIVVPGHGPVATLKEVAAFRDLLRALREAVAAAIRVGASEEAAVAEIVLPDYASMPRYREWAPFNIRAAYRYLKAR